MTASLFFRPTPFHPPKTSHLCPVWATTVAVANVSWQLLCVLSKGICATGSGNGSAKSTPYRDVAVATSSIKTHTPFYTVASARNKTLYTHNSHWSDSAPNKLGSKCTKCARAHSREAWKSWKIIIRQEIFIFFPTSDIFFLTFLLEWDYLGGVITGGGLRQRPCQRNFLGPSLTQDLHRTSCSILARAIPEFLNVSVKSSQIKLLLH